MIVGLLLAAGSGQRFGKPKALVDTGDGPSVLRSLATLAETDRQLVVVGASADTVADLLPEGVAVVINTEHAEGWAHRYGPAWPSSPLIRSWTPPW